MRSHWRSPFRSSSLLRPRGASLILALALGLGAGACEKVSHENIDKWANTEKGPKKLLKALESGDNSSELRAHAAAVLISIDKYAEVKEIVSEIRGDDQQAIVAGMVDRLWEEARIDEALAIPNSRQTGAKDALYDLRQFADPATQSKIDGYLTEWFTGGHYEARASSGKVSGSVVIRQIGESAAKGLLENARGLVAAPPDAEGRRKRVGDELLKALAISGSPDALDFLMQLIEQPRGDVSLPKRAMSAIYHAFVEPLGFEQVDGKKLIFIQEKLEKVPFDTSKSGTTRNDAMDLLAAIGAPECIPSFTRMIAYPTDDELFRWAGAQKGVRCGRHQGIDAIADALPATVSYERGMLLKYFWEEILKLGNDKKIAEAALRLMDSPSWVARVTGVEVTGLLKNPAQYSKNIEKIRSLTKDKTKLKNWWGDQKDVPKGERKSDPTLGAVAAEVAKRLE